MSRVKLFWHEVFIIKIMFNFNEIINAAITEIIQKEVEAQIKAQFEEHYNEDFPKALWKIETLKMAVESLEKRFSIAETANKTNAEGIQRILKLGKKEFLEWARKKASVIYNGRTSYNSSTFRNIYSQMSDESQDTLESYYRQAHCSGSKLLIIESLRNSNKKADENLCYEFINVLINR